jgi:hypothetical protein
MAYKNKILRYLPFGAQVDIARKYGKTPQYINQVLNGSAFNEHIFDDLMEMARKNKDRLFKIQQEMEALNK